MDETMAKVRQELEAARQWAKSFDVSESLDGATAWLQAVKLPKDFNTVREHVKTSCHPEHIKARIKAASQHPHLKQILYGVLLAIVSIWTISVLYARFTRRAYLRPSTPELEKAPTNLRKKLQGPDRKPGGMPAQPDGLYHTC